MISMFLFDELRVGPSASEVAAGGDPEHEEALMGLVKSLSQVQPAFTPCPPDDKVNSSTHRAAHAR